MNPLVSVIIPTYNRKLILGEAIESCLAQAYTNIEVLVIDDGSTDGTDAFMRSIVSGKGKHKVSYTVQKNGGACSARNHGLRLAQGEYIQFLDSDDTLHPDKVSRQISTIAASGAPDAIICYGRTGPIESGWVNAHRIGYCGSNWLGMLCSPAHFVVHTSAPLWKKDFLDQERGWDETLSCAQEWEYFIRLFARLPKTAVVEDDLFWVRTHCGEQISSTSRNTRYWVSRWRAMQSALGHLCSAGVMNKEMQRGLLSNGCTNYINILRYSQDPTVNEFEEWLRDLAKASGNFSVMWFVQLRRSLGRKCFLRVYDTFRKTRDSFQSLRD